MSHTNYVLDRQSKYTGEHVFAKSLSKGFRWTVRGIAFTLMATTFIAAIIVASVFVNVKIAILIIPAAFLVGFIGMYLQEQGNIFPHIKKTYQDGTKVYEHTKLYETAQLLMQLNEMPELKNFVDPYSLFDEAADQIRLRSHDEITNSELEIYNIGLENLLEECKNVRVRNSLNGAHKSRVVLDSALEVARLADPNTD